MTEARDAGLTPERVEALVEWLEGIARHMRVVEADGGMHIKVPVEDADSMDEAAATIAELRAERDGLREASEREADKWCRRACAEKERRIVAEAEVERLRPQTGDGSTHWEGCHRAAGHHECALAELARTDAALRTLADDMAVANAGFSRPSDKVVSGWIKRLRALAPIADQTGETTDE